ncbi:ABC transporter ATP-binding protein [Yaniella sp.]|uniref:ABC transporter ATP-binding protein n=1 Tax=Yaniella sp. TaxID=2773929 RepID=UPI00264A1449|nr:ABC transporter ATP-binding protein [Yaniella sp.]
MIRTLFALLPAGSSRAVITHLALTVVSVIMRAAGAVLLVPLIAALFGDQPANAWTWVGLLVLVTAVGWVVDWYISRIGFNLGFGLLDEGQHAISERLARIRLPWFTAQHTATARQSIAATGPDLVGIIIYLVTPILGALLLPIAIALALIPVSWPLALIALALVPVLFGAYWAAGRFSRHADREAAIANSELTERIVEFARTQHALRAARRIDPERSQVGQALAAQHGTTRKLLFMQIPGQLIFSIASQLALIALAGATVIFTVDGNLTVPEAIALIVVIVRYLEPFTSLAELSGGVETSTLTLRRIKTVLDAPTMPTGTDQLKTSTPPTIEFSEVRFGYATDEPPVLDNLSLVIDPGTTTAIVGPSGSGKSTILALLAGLHDPSAGRILLDGKNVTHLDAASRRDAVSVVFQEPYLFDGTVRDNVLAGQPSADSTALDTVARLARVDTVVRQLPDGWDAPVGEAGTALSGGERQRVSIARALLKPAPLLLVDEATSALDTENEAAITAALTDDPTPRTRVIVAHRLASIRKADRVLFIEDGRIVEDGTVDGLLASGGRFAEFWSQQDAASGWQI